MNTSYVPPCLEFTEFQSFITNARKPDDTLNIQINKTNGSIEECGKVWDRFLESYQLRDQSLRKCISEYETIVQTKEQLLADEKITTLEKASLWQDRKRLGFLKSELIIEDILKNQATVQFKSKCKGFIPVFPNPLAPSKKQQ